MNINQKITEEFTALCQLVRETYVYRAFGNIMIISFINKYKPTYILLENGKKEESEESMKLYSFRLDGSFTIDKASHDISEMEQRNVSGIIETCAALIKDMEICYFQVIVNDSACYIVVQPEKYGSEMLTIGKYYSANMDKAGNLIFSQSEITEEDSTNAEDAI